MLLRSASLLSGLALLLSACAPSLAGLIRNRHYEEAEFALHGRDAPESSRDVLSRAIEADLAPAVHLHPLSEQELARVSPDIATAVSGRFVLIRMRVETTQIPIERAHISLTLHRDSRVEEARPIATRDAIAPLLGEVLPQPRTIGPSAVDTGAEVVRGIVVLGAGILCVSTLGLFGGACEAFVSSPPAPQTQVVLPTEEDFAREAPHTEAMLRAIASWHCSDRSGDRCDELLAFPITPHDGSAEASLVFHVATAYSTTFEVSVPLGRGATLAERIQRLFGNRMRPLNEIGR